MKIGIMSMQRIENYGSFLQAYSLKQMLEDLGHDVVFVDYKVEPCLVKEPQRVIQQYSVLYRLIRKVYYTLHNLFETISGEKAEKENLEKICLRNRYSTYLKELGITKFRTEDTAVDVLVIGSDEVFNCLQTNPAVGYSRQLFGENVLCNKVISYAACAGFTTIEGLECYGIKDEIARMLKNNFSAISVRDQNTFNLVKNLTGIIPEIHLDPVLLADFSKKLILPSSLKNYIVVYSYEERMSNRNDEKKAIQSFAHKHDLKTVSIGNFQKWTDLHIEASPFELLGYIKKASYVITDTFHGTVFSIIMERPFGTIVRDSNVQKIESLLQCFGVNERRVDNLDNLEKILTSSISFNNARKVRENEKSKTLSYLSRNLC